MTIDFKGGILAAALAAAALSAHAGAAFIDFDDFNYRGSVTRYGSLADAQAGTNPISTSPIVTATNDTRSTLPDARDASIYAGHGVPAAYGVNYGYFGFAWYFTTFDSSFGNGWGNPNNTCAGLIQFNDTTGAVTTSSGAWSNGNTRFQFQLSGAPGDGGNAARLWAGGSTCGDGGAFHSFDLALLADFAVPASLDIGTGWYTSSATPTALSGTVSGIFENDSASVPANNGFYRFDLTLHNGSWAAANDAKWFSGQQTFGVSRFFASDTSIEVPLPGTLLLVLAGLTPWLGRSLIVRRRA